MIIFFTVFIRNGPTTIREVLPTVRNKGHFPFTLGISGQQLVVAEWRLYLTACVNEHCGYFKLKLYMANNAIFVKLGDNITGPFLNIDI